MSAARAVETRGAPAPVGPYSQAVALEGWVYVSGQIPLDPDTGRLVDGGIEAQTERVIANLAAVLEAAGSSLERAVKVNIYVTDLAQFTTINEIYARRFTGDPAPARATVQVAALPLGAAVEMDLVARCD